MMTRGAMGNWWRRESRSPAPRVKVPCAASRGPMWRCESRSLGTNLKPKKIEFWAFLGPSGQNQLYHTPLLFKIWDLTKNKKFVNDPFNHQKFPLALKRFYLLDIYKKQILSHVSALDWDLGVSDTQIDSIQYLNFAKKLFNSIFNSIVFHENSIQKIIQFNIFHKNSIQKIIQFKKM